MRNRGAVIAAGVALLVALSGCTTPAPEPTPTPAFTSEEEAFAAAEETYRAYVDALNQVDLSDPETFEPVFALTTGEANANERKSLSQMHADGWNVAGATDVTRFFGESYKDGIVEAVICSDVSDVKVTDASGQSKVSTDRPDVYALRVSFTPGSTPNGLAVAGSTAIKDGRCAP
ncbi:hypothetical protein [Microbacterium timonense]|uniref:hypothetical protein n=1 Tax=Microbacterium timonense TaxID=2086576 RepID=UPI000D106E7D|nr:hypothetical protein [Microbacterium timonense]